MADWGYPNRPIDRKDAYGMAKAGRATTYCDQTVAAPASYLAQTALVATTPFLLFSKDASDTRHIFRRIELAQVGTVAGGEVKIAVGLDIANRYSAGGTALVAQNMNRLFRTVGITDMTCRVNATATAQVDANIDWLKMYTAVQLAGSVIAIDFEDGLVLSEDACSLLVFVWAATTAPTLFVNADVIEEESTATGGGV